MYGAAPKAERKLFGQHDARVIANGLPGAGHVLVFNNGVGEGQPNSSVVEVELPVNAQGGYTREGKSFGPKGVVWRYASEAISSPRLPSAQRLANGNTFVCAGEGGRFVEVKPDSTVVWEYLNPYNDPRASMGPGPRGPGGRRGPHGGGDGAGPEGGPPPGGADGAPPGEGRPPRDGAGGGPGGRGPGGGRPRFGPGGPGGPGGKGANGVFHAFRVPMDHPALAKLLAEPATGVGSALIRPRASRA